MRLTHVAQMALAHGRVFSYAVRAAPELGGALPVSFDQGRHVGAGQRPGSWMALAFRLSAPNVDMDDVAAAWDAVVARHGTLRSAFTSGDAGALELREVEVTPGAWEEHAVADGRETREVLREIFDTHCAPFERPSHRLCMVVPEGEDDARPELVIGSDHAHVDMWSLVILARDLLTFLDDLRAGLTPGFALPDAPAFAEHTAMLEQMPPAPPEIQARWAGIVGPEGDGLPVFPLPLGQLDPVPAEVVEVRDVLSAESTEYLTTVARDRGVRLIALGLSVLTEVTATLADRPLRAVFPVHSRHDIHWREAVGWFITNAVLECADPDPVACIASVEEATGLGSWPLGPIFAPYGDVPAVPGMFAISWLDARRLPVPKAQASDLQYVSAAIRTDGVMIWFAVDESGLHLRCRYPDTPEARENVGRWLDAVELGLRELAARAPAG
jgi:hypothetical protein